MKKLASISILATTAALAVIGCTSQKDVQQSGEAKLTPIPENPGTTSSLHANHGNAVDVQSGVSESSSAPLELLPQNGPAPSVPESKPNTLPRSSQP